MLKKVFMVSAVCALFFGVSQAHTQGYNTQKGALGFAEYTLKDLKDSGIDYVCHGDASDARCRFRDIAFPFGGNVSNASFEVSFKEREYKQRLRFDIDINSRYITDYSNYIPRSVECSTTYSLDYTNVAGVSSCVINSDLVTLDFDVSQSIDSNEFIGKSMLSVMAHSLAKLNDYNEKLNVVHRSFGNEIYKLDKEKYDTIDRLYSDRESLQELHKQAVENEESCNCRNHKHYNNSVVALLKDRKYLESSLRDNEREIKYSRKYYGEEYDDLKDDYDVHLRALQKQIVKWLSRYDVNIKEIRIYVKAPALAKATFNLYANDLITYKKNYKLTKREKREKAEEKKRVTAGYYSSVEAMRAASITFVNESPYLSDRLKKSSAKIIDQHAKLFEPHTGKKSVKILATSIDGKPLNLGKEAQKIFDYSNDDIDRHEFLTKVFEVVNSYDIRAVRSFPY